MHSLRGAAGRLPGFHQVVSQLQLHARPFCLRLPAFSFLCLTRHPSVVVICSVSFPCTGLFTASELVPSPLFLSVHPFRSFTSALSSLSPRTRLQWARHSVHATFLCSCFLLLFLVILSNPALIFPPSYSFFFSPSFSIRFSSFLTVSLSACLYASLRTLLALLFFFFGLLLRLIPSSTFPVFDQTMWPIFFSFSPG